MLEVIQAYVDKRAFSCQLSRCEAILQLVTFPKSPSLGKDNLGFGVCSGLCPCLFTASCVILGSAFTTDLMKVIYHCDNCADNTITHIGVLKAGGQTTLTVN